jgi:hypothetical protein
MLIARRSLLALFAQLVRSPHNLLGKQFFVIVLTAPLLWDASALQKRSAAARAMSNWRDATTA